MTAPVLAGLYGVSKSFGNSRAVIDTTLEVRPGEVHCLIGENGAGKSTLIKMLAGVHAPDSGELRIGGQAVVFRSPHDALEHGISTIYQELTLVPDMSVSENLALGREPTLARGVLDRRRRAREAESLFEEIGITEISPDARVRSLGIAHQQLVEIAKAAGRTGDRVVIMDEPTAPLTRRETDTLFALVKRLRDRGAGIIYITHRLEELEEIGDRVTVMRDGATVLTGSAREMKRHELIEAMVGRPMTDLYPERSTQPGEKVLEVIEDTATGEHPVLELHRGEVVALFGLIGAGRTELARSIVGADPLEHRRLRLHGAERRFRRPSQALGAGVGIVPEDRKGQGIVPELPVSMNIALSCLPSHRRGGLLSRRSIRDQASEYSERMRIRASSNEQEIRQLSGGNQQKCLIARVLAAGSEVVILDEPTRGIDVGARFEIYQLIEELKAAGKAVLMITSDLPEAIGMSDRIVVMRRGQVSGAVPAAGATQDQVMELAIEEEGVAHSTT